MHTLEFAIIALVLAGLTLHTYLDTFYDQGRLPYAASFSIFVNLFALIYLVSFIWMFGAVAGLVISLLCYLQIVYSAGLWVFLVPFLLRIRRTPEKNVLNLSFYWWHSKIVLLVGVLTVANCVVNPYGSLLQLFARNYLTPAAVFLAALVVGNLLRLVVMRRFVKA